MRVPIEKKSYLVVDDFGDMRSMMRSMLNLFGVTRIDNASNGDEAIHLLGRNRYDVVLCDYNLGPGKDGQQVLEEARHRKLVGFGTVFIMVTAENTQEMVMGAMEYQPDAYLAKPFTKDLLRNRLEKLLIKKQNLEAVERAAARNDYAGAINELNRLMAEKPRNLAELTRLKTEFCIESGDYEQARTLFEQVLTQRDIPWARLGLGRVQYLQKNYVEARQTLQRLLESNQRITSAYDWLAKTCLALGDLSGAQELLTRAADFSPKAILRQKALGDVAMKTGSFQLAESAFNRAVRLGKHSVHKHPVLYAKLVQSQLSNDERKDKGSALEVVRAMEKAFGRDQEAGLYAAMTESLVHSVTGDETKARECLDRAEEMYDRMGGGDSELTLNLAKAAAAGGDPGRAEVLFRQLVMENHENDELLQDVEAAYRDYGVAEDARKWIDGLKKEVVDLNNKGVRLANAGQVDQAFTLFEEAAEAMPGNKVINLNAARIMIMKMEKCGADAESLRKTAQYIDRVRRIDPDDAGLARIVAKYRALSVAV